jgi:hypothetical protein
MSALQMEEIKFTEANEDLAREQDAQMTEDKKLYIITKIYEHFGRPDNIIQHELHLYKGWNAGGVQRARLTTYYSENSTDMFAETHIASWFVRIGPKQICVYGTASVEDEPDLMFSPPTNG